MSGSRRPSARGGRRRAASSRRRRHRPRKSASSRKLEALPRALMSDGRYGGVGPGARRIAAGFRFHAAPPPASTSASIAGQPRRACGAPGRSSATAGDWVFLQALGATGRRCSPCPRKLLPCRDAPGGRAYGLSGSARPNGRRAAISGGAQAPSPARAWRETKAPSGVLQPGAYHHADGRAGPATLPAVGLVTRQCALSPERMHPHRPPTTPTTNGVGSTGARARRVTGRVRFRPLNPRSTSLGNGRRQRCHSGYRTLGPSSLCFRMPRRKSSPSWAVT